MPGRDAQASKKKKKQEIVKIYIHIYNFDRILNFPFVFQVMLLKINKEGPYKKDVFRAPGHQGNTRKLIHFLQQGKI